MASKSLRKATSAHGRRAAERHVTLSPVGISDARWTGGLMGERFDTCRKVMVPNLWHIMSGTEYSQFF